MDESMFFSEYLPTVCLAIKQKQKTGEKVSMIYVRIVSLSVLVIFCADLVCMCCYGIVPVSSSLHFSVLLCFRHAHTITVLVIFSAVLVYVALVEESVPDRDYNAKR